MIVSRAASMSETIRYVLWAEPGEADVRFLPNWIEHDEPCGVNWNTPEPGGVTSCRHPSVRENCSAGLTSETGSTMTSSFISIAATFGSLALLLRITFVGLATFVPPYAFTYPRIMRCCE